MENTFSFEEAKGEIENRKTFSYEDAIGTEAPVKRFSFEEASKQNQVSDSPDYPSTIARPSGRDISMNPSREPTDATRQMVADWDKQLSQSPLDFVVPTANVNPEDGRAMAVGKTAYNLAMGIPKFVTSIKGLAATAAGMASAPVTTGYFIADMLKGLGNKIYDSYQNWDKMTPGQQSGAIAEMVGSGAMVGFLGAHLKSEVAPNLNMGDMKTAKTAEQTAAERFSNRDQAGSPANLSSKADTIAPIAPLTAEALKKTAESVESKKPVNPGGPASELPADLQAKSAANNSPEAFAAAEASKPIVDQPVNNPPQEQNANATEQVSKDKAVTDPEIFGMGGATPSEFEPGKGTASSNKNAVVDDERQQRGLPPMMTTLRQTWGESWTKAMATIDQNPVYQDMLVSDINRNPRPITDTENAALLHRRVDLRNEYEKSTREAAQAFDDGRTEAMGEARLRTAYWSDKLTDLENATKAGGSETGRALAARRMMMNEDFSLASLEMQKRSANDFRPLTDDERTELKSLADDYKSKSDVLEKHLAEQQEKTREAEVGRSLAEARANSAKNDYPQINPNILEAARKIVGRIHSKADESRAALRAMVGRTSAGVDPAVLYHLAVIGSDHLLTAALNVAEWSAKMAEDLGPQWEQFKSNADEIYKASQKELTNSLSTQTRNVRKAVGDRAKNLKDLDAKKTELAESIKEKLGAGKKNEITYFVQRLARVLVQQGVTEREPLIDEVHSILKQSNPETTRREAMDAISGYGDYKQLSQDEVSKTLRDLKGQMQQIGKLSDMEAGKAPQKTGVERRTYSDEERRLIQQVEEAKRKGGFKVTNPAQQLKSALDSIKTRLKNEISDLEHQISTREKIVRDKTAPPTDSETESLRKQRDALKEEFEKIFPRVEKPLTEAEKIKMATASVERQISEYDRRIKEKDFGNTASSKLKSSELEAVKARRDALREQYLELRDLDEHYQLEKSERDLELKRKSLEESIAEKQRKLKEGDTQPKTGQVNRPASPKLESLKQQRDALNKQLAESRKKPADQVAAEKMSRQLEGMNDRIAELEEKLASGDVSSKSKSSAINQPMSPELEKSRQRLEALKNQLKEARKKPADQKYAERLERRVADLQKRIAEKESQIASGNVSVKPGSVNRPSSSPELEIEKQRLDEVNQRIAKMRKGPKKSADEIALQAFKTRTANRIADLQDKLDRGDFSKREKRELQLDRKALSLRSELQKIRGEFDAELKRDKLSKRNGNEKFMDFISTWRRGFILSNPVVIGKLLSAAFARDITTPLEGLAGSGLRKIPIVRDIAAKAPRYGGGLNVSAEVKAITGRLTTGMRDSWEIFKTGSSELDRVYGKEKVYPKSFMNIFGNIHGMLKASVKRAEFERSFEILGQFYAKAGVDVTDPIIQTRIGLEAYAEANRAVFMEDSALAEKLNAFIKAKINPKTGHASAGQKGFETLGRIAFPVVRVPINIAAQTAEYAFGSLSGLGGVAAAYRNGIETLTQEDADLIMRHLVKGSIGGAALLAGYFTPKVFGGFYQPGEKRNSSDAGPNAANVNGVKIPAWMFHNALLQATQLGATVRRVADSKLNKHDEQPQGLSAGALAGALGLADNIPFVRESTEIAKLMDPKQRQKWVGSMAESLLVPGVVSKVAEWTDKEKRDPRTIGEHIKSGIPGLRETVPAHQRQ